MLSFNFPVYGIFLYSSPKRLRKIVILIISTTSPHILSSFLKNMLKISKSMKRYTAFSLYLPDPPLMLHSYLELLASLFIHSEIVLVATNIFFFKNINGNILHMSCFPLYFPLNNISWGIFSFNMST